MWQSLGIFKSCVLGSNYSCVKLVSSLQSPVKSEESFRVTAVAFFVPDFNSLICELDDFNMKTVILSQFILTLYKNKLN